MWLYRTTPRESTEITPFHLIYDNEVVVLVEIASELVQINKYNQEDYL